MLGFQPSGPHYRLSPTDLILTHFNQHKDHQGDKGSVCMRVPYERLAIGKIAAPFACGIHPDVLREIAGQHDIHAGEINSPSHTDR